MNVLLAQPVLVAVFQESRAGVDHENALARVRVVLVDNNNARRDAGAIEQVGRQADDALDVTLGEQILADLGFVGEPDKVNIEVLQSIVRSDMIAVIAPIGVGENGETFNIRERPRRLRSTVETEIVAESGVAT